MYFRNAAEEAQVPKLGGGWWWRVAAYSGCKVFKVLSELNNELGDRYVELIVPINELQGVQRTLERLKLKSSRPQA
jgi:hypothetical protein